MQQLMENAQEFDGYVLFDAPGNIKDDGLAVMLAYADAIVCPYEYETKSLVSTQTFIGVLEQLRELNPQMKARLFLVPNKVDTRIGTGWTHVSAPLPSGRHGWSTSVSWHSTGPLLRGPDIASRCDASIPTTCWMTRSMLCTTH